MKNLAATGTIGDGPYKWGSISPGHTYTLIKNTEVRRPRLPARARGQDRLQRQHQRAGQRRAVLNNQADVFDPGDTLPASILSQVKSQAADRFQAIPTNSSCYFFFAVNKKPFNNLYARQAVLAALDSTRAVAARQRASCTGLPPDPVRDRRPLQPVQLPASTIPTDRRT